MKFSVFQLSRKGGRSNNQDRMGYSFNRESAFFAVADGMGGHPEGEVAAQIALQSSSNLFQRRPLRNQTEATHFLEAALLYAHREILKYANGKGMPVGPRTTFVACTIVDGWLTTIHCGDSRLYLIRNGVLWNRTRDHSYAEQPHLLSPQAREKDINRNVLFTCLGSPVDPLFSVSEPIELQEGDKIFLCSDGLWGPLVDEEIVDELWDQPIAKSSNNLVELALRRAGIHSDNVTVLTVSWDHQNQRLDDPTTIFTHTLTEGVYASTITDATKLISTDEMNEMSEMSLSSIEASIAAINASIKKANNSN
jgi:serine/threonine protein phosphatase PrpC